MDIFLKALFRYGEILFVNRGKYTDASKEIENSISFWKLNYIWSRLLTFATIIFDWNIVKNYDRTYSFVSRQIF